MKYVIAALLLALPVVAQESPDQKNAARKAIAERDADGDGRLTLAEFGGGSALFELLDGNGDGFLAADELPKPRRKNGNKKDNRKASPEQVRDQAMRMMKRLDKNGDGTLSADEVPEQAKILKRADRNKDGAVDLLELTVAISKQSGRARGDASRGLQMMKRMDKNGDGAIERTEWRGPENAFGKLDADGDGRITKEELKRARMAGADGKDRGRWRSRAGDALFRRADENQDGKIARDEWPMRPELFDRLDANGDGFITRAEVTPKGGRRRGPNIDLRAGKDSAHFLEKYDKNRDGSVSKEEFPHGRRFAEIDTAGDGTLSSTEIRDAMDKRRHEEGYDFLERFDLNTDGKVTRDEFTGPAAEFERRDRNRDGVIDATDKPDKPDKPDKK